MDTRVLLANTNKRFDAIFNGLAILNKQQETDTGNTLEAFEVLHEKIVELDNKLDAIMAHLGLVLPESVVEPESMVGPGGPDAEPAEPTE
jgi:hypothetical protein